MNLNTGKIISRRKITEIPAMEEDIARVEELAKRDKMQPNLVFKSQKGIIAEAENTGVNRLLYTDPDVKLDNKSTDDDYKVEPESDKEENLIANDTMDVGELYELINNTIINQN